MKCNAHNAKTGKPCGNNAIKGGTVCFQHGGKTPQVRRKAAERVAEAKARAAIDRYAPEAHRELEDPVGALLAVAQEALTFKDFIAQRIAELRADEYRYDHRAGEQLRAEIALYERAMDRTSRILTDINRLGLDERIVRLRESQAVMIMGALTKILDDLELTQAQRAIAEQVVPARLRELESPGEQAGESRFGRKTPAPLPRAR